MESSELLARVNRNDNLVGRFNGNFAKRLAEQNSKPIINLGSPIKEELLSVRPEGNKAGRYLLSPNIPSKFKDIIGTISRISGATEAAKTFGISSPTALSFERGKTGLHEDAKLIPGLKEKIEENVDKVREIVLEKISFGLDSITKEKMGNLSPREASTVIRNLAGVLSATKKPAEINTNNNAQVVVMTPTQKDVSQYNRIEVNSDGK